MHEEDQRVYVLRECRTCQAENETFTPLSLPNRDASPVLQRDNCSEGDHHPADVAVNDLLQPSVGNRACCAE